MAKGKPSTQSDPAAPENTAEDTVFSRQSGSSKSAPHYRIFVRDLVLTGLIGATLLIAGGILLRIPVYTAPPDDTPLFAENS